MYVKDIAVLPKGMSLTSEKRHAPAVPRRENWMTVFSWYISCVALYSS